MTLESNVSAVRWVEYVPPASHLATAIQYPLDARWPDRVINAYARDAAERRAAAKEK